MESKMNMDLTNMSQTYMFVHSKFTRKFGNCIMMYNCLFHKSCKNNVILLKCTIILKFPYEYTTEALSLTNQFMCTAYSMNMFHLQNYLYYIKTTVLYSGKNKKLNCICMYLS